MQSNDPRKHHTLDIIEAVRWLAGKPKREDEEPQIWVVHCISPSAYSEDKFRRVLEGLKTYNIGVICCPIAAETMLQLRSVQAPIHSSVARVLEMALSGIRLRFGTDNIRDMYIPSSRGSMLEEMKTLARMIRFECSPQILAKFACGVMLNRSDEDIIRRHLEEYVKTCRRANPEFKFCMSLE